MTRFAGAVDLTSYLDDSSDWSKAADATSAGRSSNRITGIQAEAGLGQVGLKSLADLRAAEYEAEAIEAGAEAEASAKTQGAIFSGLGSIGSAGVKAYGKANNLGIYE